MPRSMPTPTPTATPVTIDPLSALSGLTPDMFDLPSKFNSFRPQQLLAAERTLTSTKRFKSHALPVGSGKSLFYVLLALLNGARVAVLTSTKALQQQLLDDFAGIGLVSVMGRNNFDCVTIHNCNCEEGAHAKCGETFKRMEPDSSPMDSRCPYRQQYQRALSAQLVVTNYSYWALIHQYGEGLGKFDLLVLDEAHNAADEVTSTLTIQLTGREVESMLRADWPIQPLWIDGWRQWAKALGDQAEAEHKRVSEAVMPYMTPSSDLIRGAMAWKALLTKLKRLATIRGEWVVERVSKGGDDGYRLECVWPYTYSEDLLFRGIEDVLLVSGTLVGRTLNLLGLTPSDYDHFVYPSTFPRENWPIYHIPGVDLNHKSTAADFQHVVDCADQVIAGRLDRKGIIHTTSYARARDFIQGSVWKDIIITHDNRQGDVARATEKFRNAPAPAVLVSPSVTTGHDFPSELCEYQVIVKAPYPDLSSLVQLRRTSRDRLYPAYQMAVTLQQMTGRGMRHDRDWCENFILDGSVHKIVKRNPYLFAKWWLDQYRVVVEVPVAPPPMGMFPPRQVWSG